MSSNSIGSSKAESLPSLGRLKVRDFKGLRDVSLDLRPLTILTGANSRGKSSIIQSILLLTSFDDQGNLPLNSGALSLGTAGEVVRRRKGAGSGSNTGRITLEVKGPLSTTHSVIFCARDSNDLSLEVTELSVISKQPNGPTDLKMTKRRDPKNSATLGSSVSTLSGSGPNFPSYVLKTPLATTAAADGRESSRLTPSLCLDLNAPLWSRGIFGSVLPDQLLFRSSFRAFLLDFVVGSTPIRTSSGTVLSKQAVELSEIPLKSVKSAVKNFIVGILSAAKKLKLDRDELPFLTPELLLRFQGQALQRMAKQGPSKPLSASLPSDFGSVKGIAEIIRNLDSPDLDSDVLFQKSLGPPTFDLSLDSYLSPAATQWNEYLNNRVKYLGPLREREFSTSIPTSSQHSGSTPLGARAEFLAHFLYQAHVKSEKRSYPVPEVAEEQELSLLQAVDRWACGYFGLGSSLSVKPEGFVGPVIRLDDSRFQNLGAGVSQLLPVITLCLSVRPGQTVILEQPELHLHPGLQQKLASFLAFMSKLGRQIIVETHSEYFVTKIRRHVAEGVLELQDVALVFVQPNGAVEQRGLAKDGALDGDWPEEFFDFSLEDSIVLMNASHLSSEE